MITHPHTATLASRWATMTDAQRRERLRTAVEHTVTLAQARRDIRRWRYGQREHRQADNRDLRL